MSNGDPGCEYAEAEIGFAAAATLLHDARRTGRTIAALPDDVRPGSFAEGYRIQDRLIDLDGRPVALVKIGCTTAETQRIMNLSEPIGGCLSADALHRSGAELRIDDFHHPPLIECEFAMRVGSDLDPGRGIRSLADAMAVADAVAPALELVDGRYDDQLGIDGPSVVADNSMATAAVLGPAVAVPSEIDPDQLGTMAVRLVAHDHGGGEPVLIAEGNGSNVLGDPWRSFHWALDHLASRGRPVPAGTWIITGSCSGAPVAPLGRRLTATFDGLGEVSVTISR